MNGTDDELLALFRRESSQEAFSEVVARHLDVVYSAALRQVGSPETADEISQSVFQDLARQASRGRIDAPLGAWLYVVTRRTAVDAIRRESRQRAREKAAAELSAAGSAVDYPWLQVRPVLDEAMAELSSDDRNALVLRFFENLSLREVGAALGSSEDAAQKRVSRALDGLRRYFHRRGISVASATLAADLTSRAVESSPLGLAATISANVGAGHTAAAAALAFAMTTTQTILISSLAAIALATIAYEAHVVNVTRGRVATLEKEAAVSQAREQRLRDERTDLLRRSAASSPTNPEPTPGSPSGVPSKVDQAKQLFSMMTGRWIPELELLTDEDWLKAVASERMDTEYQRRDAFSGLRVLAKIKFTNRFKAAEASYEAATGGQIPSDVGQLLPYFDPAINPLILQRYEIVQAGPGSAPNSGFVVMERSQTLVDDEFDTQLRITSGSSVTGPNWSFKGVARTQDAMSSAWKRYQTENAGAAPNSFEVLLPYFDTTFDSALARELFDSQAKPKGENPATANGAH